jgi:hypothetical protein
VFFHAWACGTYSYSGLALSIGLACRSKKNHRCLKTSSEITGNLLGIALDLKLCYWKPHKFWHRCLAPQTYTFSSFDIEGQWHIYNVYIYTCGHIVRTGVLQLTWVPRRLLNWKNSDLVCQLIQNQCELSLVSKWFLLLSNLFAICTSKSKQLHKIVFCLSSNLPSLAGFYKLQFANNSLGRNRLQWN